MVKVKRKNQMQKTSNNLGYKKLIVYQKSKALVLEVYKITSYYPRTEIYTLVPQMRRAAISVLANVVEGYSKETSAEYARFLTISIGSIAELEVYIEISHDLNFIDNNKADRMNKLIIEVKKLLYGSRKAVRTKID